MDTGDLFLPLAALFGGIGAYLWVRERRATARRHAAGRANASVNEKA
ncbi:MAG: hypothetical protein ACYDBQ_01275 [Thermoplasmatota archaeon]